MTPGSRTLAGLTLIAALLSGACGDERTGPGDDTARVTVRLTDAPGDVSVAVVTIEEVYLQGGAEGRITLSDDPVTVDLLTLANTTITLVDQQEIPAGTYSELRFRLSGAYIEVETENGGSVIYASDPGYPGLPSGVTADGNLIMPSLGSSGLKVQFPGALTLTGDHDLLVDFDVSESFGQQAGGSGNWVMHPVIKGIQTDAAAELTVTLALGEGVTLPEIGGVPLTLAHFTANVGGRLMPFAAVGGVYQASYELLVPGPQQVTLVVPAGIAVTTNPAIPLAVDLEAGSSGTAALVIVAVELLPGG